MRTSIRPARTITKYFYFVSSTGHVKRCLVFPVASGWNTMDHVGALDTEDELGPLAHLAPSPQSEAVAHEFQELSLQSSQHLPPLNERKN
ncbi:Hypothetical predicted protein, partial [Marmota monax]